MKWALLFLMIWCNAAQAACRQALVIALDVSGSVDATEYQLQRNGLATALSSADVSNRILAPSGAPIDIAIFEWSGPFHQEVIQPWISLNDAETLRFIINRLRTMPRITGDPTTAIGSAMVFGSRMLAAKSHCWQRTIDISGDGKANTGPRPQDLGPDVLANITINGLVIGSGDQFNRDERAADIKELSAYFQTYVIRGTDAFVETALGFEDYAAAMERKLLRELSSTAIGAAPENLPITIGLSSIEMPRQRHLVVKPR